MDVDKNTVQPRISELKKRMLVTEAGKRPCEVSSHDISVTTWKTVFEPEEETENQDFLLKDEESGQVIAE